MLSFSWSHCYWVSHKQILLVQLLQILQTLGKITQAARSKLHDFFLDCWEKPWLVGSTALGTVRPASILKQLHLFFCRFELELVKIQRKHSTDCLTHLLIYTDTRLKKICCSLLLFTCQLFQILEGLTFRLQVKLFREQNSSSMDNIYTL